MIEKYQRLSNLLSKKVINWDEVELIIESFGDNINDKYNDSSYDDGTILSELYFNSDSYERGEILVKLTRLFLKHGYDVHANNDFNGAICLHNLCWAFFVILFATQQHLLTYAYTPYGEGEAGGIIHTTSGKHRFHIIRLAENDETGAYAEYTARIISYMNGTYIKEKFYAIPLEELSEVNRENAKPSLPFYKKPRTIEQK